MNITLIGMPGAGKSTIGVLLAKTMGMDFIDTDILIQNKHKMLLQQIVDEQGYEGFVQIEEAEICTLDCANAVISPGGSVVYSERAMQWLRSRSTVVYLDVEIKELTRRLENIATRGVVFRPGQDLQALFEERRPLYLRHAHFTIGCQKKDAEQILLEVQTAIGPQAKN